MYTLTGVDIVSRGSNPFTAKVCGVDSSGIPTSTCTELTAPATIAAGTMSFTAPSNTTLDRGTTYTVLMSGPTSSDSWGFGHTGNDAEDTGKATGWSIGNEFDFILSGDWTTSDSNSVRIAINGSAVGGETPAACTLNEGDIWCGVMDVGDITNNSVTQSHGFQGTTGDLSDKTFSLMFETGTTNNYTIVAIVVGATTANSEQLYFVTSSSLTDTEEESLALHVDGESDPFVWSDSTELIAGSYRWPARTDLDWSSETTVTLRLREFPRPTVTNVEVTSTPVLESDTYGAGETIEVSVTFSEAVDATSDTDFVLSVAGGQARAAGERLGHGDAGVRLHRGGRRRGRQRHLDRGRDRDPGGQPRRVAPGRRDHERGQRRGGGHRPCRARHAVGPQGGRHAFDRLGGGDLGAVAGDGHLRGGRDDPVHGDLQRPGGRGRGPGFGVPVRRQRA